MPSDPFIIPFIPVLDALDLASNEILMEEQALRLPIMTSNWPVLFPYIPITAVDLAYTESGLYLRFHSRGRGMRATASENGSRVHIDSCVEAFIRIPGEERYRNFEFNCIGTCDASYRKDREESEPLTPKEYEEISVASSERRDTLFERTQGVESFWVSVKISWKLFGSIPEAILANFYKCGDETVMPHYASWQPVDSLKPDFHRPESFARLLLAPRP